MVCLAAVASIADTVGDDQVALDISDGAGGHTIVTIQAPAPG